MSRRVTEKPNRGWGGIPEVATARAATTLRMERQRKDCAVRPWPSHYPGRQEAWVGWLVQWELKSWRGFSQRTASHVIQGREEKQIPGHSIPITFYSLTNASHWLNSAHLEVSWHQSLGSAACRVRHQGYRVRGRMPRGPEGQQIQDHCMLHII